MLKPSMLFHMSMFSNLKQSLTATINMSSICAVFIQSIKIGFFVLSESLHSAYDRHFELVNRLGILSNYLTIQLNR